MSQSLPERADLRQLKTLAKELLRDIQSGTVIIDDVPASSAKLADAQRVLARRYGFNSWAKLAQQVEVPMLLEEFRSVIRAGDHEALEKLLKKEATLRQRINEPLFSFGAPAVIPASHSPNAAWILPILVRYGADPNVRSTWWAGGFSALDAAEGSTVDVLLNLGAKFDVWSAAKHGRIDVLKELLEEDPSLVNAGGGDGCTPLHFAQNAAVVEFLVANGADVHQKDVDHESTPIHYQIKRPDCMRALLKAGARSDIFTAIALDDAELAQQLLDQNPEVVNAKVGSGEFRTQVSNGGHIYAYLLGSAVSAIEYAATSSARAVSSILLNQAPVGKRLLAASWQEDRQAVEAILREFPNAGSQLGPESRAIADAAQQGKAETVRLLLMAGVDANSKGMDSGTALHIACWFGQLECVQLLVPLADLEAKDAHHGSTPLGWALHGSEHCRNPQGDYVGVVETLLAAGARADAPANSQGTSMMKQAGSREDVKSVLKRHIGKG